MTAPDSTDQVVAELHARLGDPTDHENPLGTAAVLAADEAGVPLRAGELLLRERGFAAELVPTADGGRFHRVGRTAALVRALARRDPALALDFGLAGFAALWPLWATGHGDQRRRAADTLLAGRRIHAGGPGTLTLSRSGGRLLLDGRAPVDGDPRDAGGLLLRAAADGTERLLLLDPTTLPAERYAAEPPALRRPRAPRPGAVVFRHCPVPDAGTAQVAPPDVAGARDVAAVLAASAAIGILDTQLRTATDFALGRVLYGRPVAGLPLVRATLTAAFVDLLAADGLVTAAAEAVHAGPEQADAVAPVAALLVPELLLDADRRLAALLGARSFLREGPQATFQLNSRELRTLGNRLAAFGPTPPTRTGPLPAACRQAVLAHTPAELLGDHDWARAGRQRFADLLGPARQAAEPATDDRLFAELSDRHRDFRSFDLADRVLV